MSERSRSAGASGVQLSSEVEEKLFFQQYGTQPEIAGVSLDPLRKHPGENGWFMEMFRLTSSGQLEELPDGFALRQISASYADPGRINAFHIHPRVRQDEVWIVLHGKLVVWLADCRSGSATEGNLRKVILTGESPGRLTIPAGVAHGYRAGDRGAILVYAMNQQFSADDSNEGRLPWDHFGEHLWEIDRG